MASCAEFSYNNKIQSSTGHSPFYVNYGRHPYKGTNLKKEVKSQSATEFAEEMSKIWEETTAALHLASEQMKTYYDCKRNATQDYKPGDKVWLEGYNITTDRPSKKLDDKRYGPFKVIKKIGKAAYKLELPKTWKSIWPVINKIFLTPYIAPIYPSQKQPAQPPPEIVDEYEEYEVEGIMDSRLSQGRLQYLVKWKGYPKRHEWTWEPLRNLTHVDQAVDDFHKSHPAAP